MYISALSVLRFFLAGGTSVKSATFIRRQMVTGGKSEQHLIMFEIASMTKSTMTRNNNDNNNYINYIGGEFSCMYLYSKSSAH